MDPKLLRRSCDPEEFQFRTTADLEDLGEIIGQARAMDALRFGIGIRHEGYNLFVLGPAGMGKRTAVRQFLESKASKERQPDDWCYINNFSQPHKPRALRLPPGRGSELREDMEELVDYLRTAIPALFESDEYRAKVEVIRKESQTHQEQMLKDLGADSEKQGVALLRTSQGYALTPVRGNEAVPPDEYEKLPVEERECTEAGIAQFQERLEKILAQMPKWRRERSERIRQFNKEIALSAVEHVMDELRSAYSDLPEVLSYLDEVQEDMVEHVDNFRKKQEAVSVSGVFILAQHAFHSYQVNVLVSNDEKPGAPIIIEDNPTYGNVLGRVEHVAQLGALVTDFTSIRPGSLHRANGGYLLLDVRKVLMQPFSWEGLKRAVQAREISIESLGQMYGLISMVSLEPEPIPLDAKIVLFGDRLFYYLLQELDPEFRELFKVTADFEERIARDAGSLLLYARLISTLGRKESLLPFDRDAVARIIEQGARLAGDSERLSMHIRSIADLLREGDYWARAAGHEVVKAVDVQQAIDAQIVRQSRLKDRLQEEILRNTLMIDTQGAVIGQVNGLSVIELGGFAFAQPTRITATTRFGDGKLINIEREVKLSGAVHSKGVLILSSFLAARYARDQPLAVSASLVFEQSYGMVEGDSASMAELCALLSNLASAPIKQSLAISGSVNQIGQAQAIGAVNEKIEGFFDICAARGLSGDQGVLIPAPNIKHLMLRQDVVKAAANGRFHVYAIETVDQAISLLTGLPAGEPDSAGQFPSGSINGRVSDRLRQLTEISKAFTVQHEKKLEEKKG